MTTPWLLAALVLTAAHVGAVLLGVSPPLSSVLLLAMAAAWLAFSWRVLGRPQHETPAQHGRLLDEQRKLAAELREFVAREIEGTRGEIERTRALVSAAAAELNRAFAEMEGESRVSGSGRRIHDSVGTAVRSLQFEDIAAQALAAANVHLERLQAINRDATRLQDTLAAADATPEARMQAMEEFLRYIKGVRDSADRRTSLDRAGAS